MKYWILFFSLTVLWSCGDKNQPNSRHASDHSDTLHTSVEPPDEKHGNRHLWQKPGIVIEKMGDISDKVIADIGAGLGYFSFRLTPLAQKVIAIDVDTQMIQFIESHKTTYIMSDIDKLECRIAQPDNPNLLENEVDIILIINTIAYLPDLNTYLQLLKKSLKPDGLLMIVDYKMKKMPIEAPPRDERVYLDQLEIWLENSGYTLLESDDTSLEFQYIIKAKNNK
jgi:2-polyprenyl-3-methyl-5-hydroxy-6-metoxy-1,4-benzoquinol methylase